MIFFNKRLPRNELLRRIGNISQVAGAQRLVCNEGIGKGTSVIRVRNGGGLDFSVIPDRSMDILDVYYRGVPLAWISKSGLVHPGYCNDRDASWLRSFGGGMLTTCGLRNVGPPVDDNGEHFGLHGRISSLPAMNVNISEDWVRDDNASSDSWNDFSDPVHGIDEIVYLHNLRPSPNHIASYELWNPGIGIGTSQLFSRRKN